MLLREMRGDYFAQGRETYDSHAKCMNAFIRRLAHLNMIAGEFYKSLSLVSFLRRDLLQVRFNTQLARMYKKLPDVAMLEGKSYGNIYNVQLMNTLYLLKDSKKIVREEGL